MKKKTNYLIYTFLLMGLLSLLFSSCKKDDKTEDNTVKDIDGNVYKTVTMGEQVWMVENLKVTKYNDGSPITPVTDNTVWGSTKTEAYCWYDNDATSNKNTYGALYNWFAVNTGKLAPTGWHVPSDDEWETLSNFLVSSGSSFTATLAGYRSEYGSFNGKTEYGCWWSSTIITAFGNTHARCRYLEDAYSTYDYDECNRKEGQSIRCIKN